MEYVRRTAGAVTQTEVARAAKVTGPTVSRWVNGKQGVDPAAAANFARTYGRPVLEAFVAAGFLTADEAKVRPAAAPDFTQLTNDELLELVRARMREEGERHDSAAANKPPGPGPADQPGTVSQIAARDIGERSRGQRRRDALEGAGEESQDPDDGEPS